LSALGASRRPFAMSIASRGLLDKHTLPPSASKSVHLLSLRSLLLLCNNSFACCCSSMAKAGLDNLDPETADQARFMIQAQDLIDPEVKGQHFRLHMIINVPPKLVMLPIRQLACLFGNLVMPYVVRRSSCSLHDAGGALWRKKALALLQSADEDHADTAEVLKWAEQYFGTEKWQKWRGTTS